MIHLLFLKQKYEIFAVYCAQIKDLNNLCVRPTIACLQATVFLKEIKINYFMYLRYITFAKAKV